MRAVVAERAVEGVDFHEAAEVHHGAAVVSVTGEAVAVAGVASQEVGAVSVVGVAAGVAFREAVEGAGVVTREVLTRHWGSRRLGFSKLETACKSVASLCIAGSRSTAVHSLHDWP